MTTNNSHPDRQYGSKLALGSWHVFPRLTLDESVELVQAALDRNISQFDIGDYWDHDIENTTRFREVMARIGAPREAYTLQVKLFTNSAERRVDVLKNELQRLGVEQVEFAICSRPSPTESVEEAVDAMAELVHQGLTQRLALSLWEPKPAIKAEKLFREKGLQPPQFVQYQYNIARRTIVDSPDYRSLFETSDVKLQAAFTLEGGILAGHVERERFGESERERGLWFKDRNIARDSGGIRPRMIALVPKMAETAKKLGVSPAQFVMAFAATHPNLDTLLFGATKVWQLDEALGAVRLADERRDEIRALAAPFEVDGAAQPALFDPSAGLH